MNKSLLVFTLLMMFRCCAAAPSLAAGAPRIRQASHQPAGHLQLAARQAGPHGLLGNQENENFCGVYTNDPAWPTGSTVIFVPSQAWYLFGAWNFNPMAYDYPAAADLNSDGRIDFEDFSKLARYWGQEEASCPIAPLPVPDGQINAKDLAALAKYWLRDIAP